MWGGDGPPRERRAPLPEAPSDRATRGLVSLGFKWDGPRDVKVLEWTIVETLSCQIVKCTSPPDAPPRTATPRPARSALFRSARVREYDDRAQC